DSAIGPPRFRKNSILETDPGAAPDSGAGALPEFDWVGHRLHIGEVVCEVVMPISRCVMVGLPQAELPHDRAILRSLATNTGMNLGVYLRVVRPGTITGRSGAPPRVRPHSNSAGGVTPRVSWSAGYRPGGGRCVRTPRPW